MSGQAARRRGADAPARLEEEVPPEYPRRSREWYIARRLGCLDRYEAQHRKPVTVIDAVTLEPV